MLGSFRTNTSTRMERLCCPFLTLQIAASGDRADWLLTLTGPEGVKPLIRAEFPTP
jgi:hypothetical protein